jgi:hypothetical protein
MKKAIGTLVLFCLTMAFFMPSCTTSKESAKANNPEGVWKLVSAEWKTKSKTIIFPSDSLKNYISFKLYTNTHWNVVGQDTTLKLFYAHGGTYKLKGVDYVEFYDYAKDIQMIGDSGLFKLQVDGDKMFLSSSWLKEEWKRIE